MTAKLLHDSSNIVQPEKDEPTTEEKLEQLEKVLQSQTLEGSGSLKSLLQYVVLKVIEDRATQLKEYTLATEVFGRSGNFDSHTDSVVRVQAKRLRSKLQEYYDNEGASDRVLISLPKGHYSATFAYVQPRQETSQKGYLKAASGDPSPSSLSVDTSVTPDRDKIWRLTAVAAIIILAIAVVILTIANREMRKQENTRFGDAHAEYATVWGPVLNSDAPTMLVLSNPVVYRFSNPADPEMLLKKSVELTPEESGWLAESLKDRFVMKQKDVPKLILATADYTGMGEAISAHRISELFSTAGRTLTVKQSRTVSAEDVKGHNLILLGSVWANEWSGKLSIKEDFTHSVNATIVNNNPGPGEEREYKPSFDERTGESTVDYALITVKPGVNDQNTLMILGGIKSEGTQAAGEFVTRKEYLNTLNQRLRRLSETGGSPKYYQVLLKVDIDNGIPTTITPVAVHSLEVTRN
jgi:hypothetical protein